MRAPAAGIERKLDASRRRVAGLPAPRAEPEGGAGRRQVSREPGEHPPRLAVHAPAGTLEAAIPGRQPLALLEREQELLTGSTPKPFRTPRAEPGNEPRGAPVAGTRRVLDLVDGEARDPLPAFARRRREPAPEPEPVLPHGLDLEPVRVEPRQLSPPGPPLVGELH